MGSYLSHIYIMTLISTYTFFEYHHFIYQIRGPAQVQVSNIQEYYSVAGYGLTLQYGVFDSRFFQFDTMVNW